MCLCVGGCSHECSIVAVIYGHLFIIKLHVRTLFRQTIRDPTLETQGQSNQVIAPMLLETSRAWMARLDSTENFPVVFRFREVHSEIFTDCQAENLHMHA